jgi:hypothetical protein
MSIFLLIKDHIHPIDLKIANECCWAYHPDLLGPKTQ